MLLYVIRNNGVKIGSPICSYTYLYKVKSEIDSYFIERNEESAYVKALHKASLI